MYNSDGAILGGMTGNIVVLFHSLNKLCSRLSFVISNICLNNVKAYLFLPPTKGSMQITCKLGGDVTQRRLGQRIAACLTAALATLVG